MEREDGRWRWSIIVNSENVMPQNYTTSTPNNNTPITITRQQYDNGTLHLIHVPSNHRTVSIRLEPVNDNLFDMHDDGVVGWCSLQLLLLLSRW
jgi:hypothetical protein